MIGDAMGAIFTFYLVFAVTFAVAVRETVAGLYDLPAWGVVLVFIAAHGVSLVPFVRGAVVLWVAWQYLPWYGAIPTAVAVCLVREVISQALWRAEKRRR